MVTGLILTTFLQAGSTLHSGAMSPGLRKGKDDTLMWIMSH